MQFTALGFIEHVPNQFRIEVILTFFDSKRERSDDESVGNNSERVNVTFLGIFFGVLNIKLHDFGSDVTHRATFVINVIFIGFGSKSKIT